MALVIFPFPLHQYSLLLKGNHIALGARERHQPCRGALQGIWVLGGLGSARRVQFWEGAGKTWAAVGVPVWSVLSSRPFVLITPPLVSGHLGTDFMPGSLTLKALFSFSSLFLPYFSLVLAGSTFQVRHTVLIEKNLLKIVHKDHLSLENPREGLETMCAIYKETLTLRKQEKFCFIPKCSFMKA